MTLSAEEWEGFGRPSPRGSRSVEDVAVGGLALSRMRMCRVGSYGRRRNAIRAGIERGLPLIPSGYLGRVLVPMVLRMNVMDRFDGRREGLIAIRA